MNKLKTITLIAVLGVAAVAYSTEVRIPDRAKARATVLVNEFGEILGGDIPVQVDIGGDILGGGGPIQVQVVGSRYTDNGDGTVTDNVTGLMWEQKTDDGSIHDFQDTYTWSTGTNDPDGTAFTVFLATLNSGGGFAGYTDWRLPTIGELQGIRAPGLMGPSIQAEYFGPTPSSIHWSSTTQYNPSYAWGVHFDPGDTRGNFKTFSTSVRAVRAGS